MVKYGIVHSQYGLLMLVDSEKEARDIVEPRLGVGLKYELLGDGDARKFEEGGLIEGNLVSALLSALNPFDRDIARIILRHRGIIGKI